MPRCAAIVSSFNVPTEVFDLELSRLFQAVTTSNQLGNEHALPDPYYGFEDVGRAIYGLKATADSSALKKETFAGSAYSAQLLLHLMARNNLKSLCQDGWPNFNRIGHKRFIPAETWQYGLLKCSEGVEETRQYPSEYTWENSAKKLGWKYAICTNELSAKPHLLLLWLIMTHRLTSDVGRVLDAKLKVAFKPC